MHNTYVPSFVALSWLSLACGGLGGTPSPERPTPAPSANNPLGVTLPTAPEGSVFQPVLAQLSIGMPWDDAVAVVTRALGEEPEAEDLFQTVYFSEEIGASACRYLLLRDEGGLGNVDVYDDPDVCGMSYGSRDTGRSEAEQLALAKIDYLQGLIPRGAPYGVAVSKAEAILGPRADTDDGAAWYVPTHGGGCRSLVLLRDGDVMERGRNKQSTEPCPE